MNRKLQHSVTALTATAAVFGLLLLAGGPPPLTVPMPGAEALVAEALAAEGLVAAETVDTPPADVAEGEAVTRRLRHQRRARTGLALPYFSFAQELRIVTGS